MQDITHKKGKVYYSMGEVAEMFDVQPSLLRYWEKKFDVLKPHRNKKGNRLFTPHDVDNLKVIYHLLKEKKMKIEVAGKVIRDHKKEYDRDAEIVERLTSIRSILQQIKQDMLYGASDDERQSEESAPTATRIRTEGLTKAAAKGTATDNGTATNSASAGPGAKKSTPGERALFEIVVPEDETPSLDDMINSFIAKNYDPESDDSAATDIDPFQAFAGESADSAACAARCAVADNKAADNGSTAGDEAADKEEKPKAGIIEQTLF